MGSYYRRNQFCQQIGVSQLTLNKWIREGLPYIRVSHGVVIIEVTSALAWIKAQGKVLGGDALSIRQAAQLAHVHQETVRYWKRTDPTFAAVLIQKNHRYIISKQRFLWWLKKRKRQSSNRKEDVEHVPVHQRFH